MQRDTVYALAVSRIIGVGSASFAKLVTAYPSDPALADADPSEMLNRLGPKLTDAVVRARGDLPAMMSRAEEDVERHQRRGITPLALTSADYPDLLRKISDPPVILFVRGRVEYLRRTRAVAVIGTREPTVAGAKVARRVAGALAEAGCIVVAGLAKGIDAAAHEGALEVGGITVAVLPTAADKIYPREHERLAERIADSGALVSEYPIGYRTTKASFVQRDRIQSGLSVAVVPVQTDVTGGTMHTVRYAKAHGRLLLCPQPIDSESSLKQYAGIRLLLEQGVATAFGKADYPAVVDRIEHHERMLLGEVRARTEVSGTLSVFSEASVPRPDLDAVRREMIMAGLSQSEHTFDEAIEVLRQELFGKTSR